MLTTIKEKYQTWRWQQEHGFQGTYFQWIKAELSGWNKTAWAMVITALIIQIILFFFNFANNHITFTPDFTFLKISTFLGASLGFMVTVAMAQKRSINGLLGAISVIFLVIVNWQTKHYGSVVDQFVYLLAIDLPMMISWRGWTKYAQDNQRYFTAKQWGITAILVLIGWAVFYPILVAVNDSVPLWDSLTLSIGTAASIAFILRFTNTFSLWLIADFVNILLWFQTMHQFGFTASLPMLVSTIMYTLSSIYGYIYWRQQDPKPLTQPTHPPKKPIDLTDTNYNPKH